MHQIAAKPGASSKSAVLVTVYCKDFDPPLKKHCARIWWYRKKKRGAWLNDATISIKCIDRKHTKQSIGIN